MPNSSLNPAPPPAFTITGRQVFAAFTLFFLIVLAANAAILVLARRTMPGIDVRSAFEASQHFNDDIARGRAQAARGWQGVAALAREGDGAWIHLDLATSAGEPIRALTIAATMQHPAAQSHDRAARLIETTPGHYAARLDALGSGAWTLRIEAKQAETPVYLSRHRLVLRD